MLPLNLFHLFTVRSDHAYINKKYQSIVIIKLGSKALLNNILWVLTHFHTSSTDCNHYQIEQIIDWIISDPFSWVCPTSFPQTNMYATVHLRTHVYTRLVFMKLTYDIYNTEVPHLHLPLSLSCLYTLLCHIFFTVLPFSSISLSMMMFSPFGMVPKIFSCIPLLYVQACYMHNILYVSYSFYSSQWLYDQTYCKQNSIP